MVLRTQLPPMFYQKAGARVHTLFATPDGYWINHGCGATNLEPLKEVVKTMGVPLGFAFDGDGDRVMAVTSSGRVLDGDDLMAIIVKYLSQRRLWDPKLVVGTLMTNSGFEEFLKKMGGELVRTNVGDNTFPTPCVRMVPCWVVNLPVMSFTPLLI